VTLIKEGDIDRQDGDIEPVQKRIRSSDTNEEDVYEQDVSRCNICNYKTSCWELGHQVKSDSNNRDGNKKFLEKNFSRQVLVPPDWHYDPIKNGKIPFLHLKNHRYEIPTRGCLISLNQWKNDLPPQ
jgi:hypothetical protein